MLIDIDGEPAMLIMHAMPTRLAEETSRIGLRLPLELHERLRPAAHEAGLSESELAHEAIDSFLAKGA